MTFDYIVIGAGQAGLSIAYYLKQAGFRFLVVDNGDVVGASWLNRWDSLKLFTPSQYNHLPGLDFPLKKNHYPDKQEVAAYLQQYVSHFDIPVKLNCEVKKVTRCDDGYCLKSNLEDLNCKNVVVATGPFHTPFIPPFYQALSDGILQLHSSEYKRPSQLNEGDALVVGAGDSGVQILQELADTERNVYLSGSCSGSVLPQEFLGKTLWWWFSKSGFLSINKYSRLGKKLCRVAQPIIGTDVKSLLRRGNVTALGKATGGRDETIEFADTKISSIKNIIWATGFKPYFDWIDGLELDDGGYPINYRGIGKQKGMYFIGLPWMYTRGSATLGGVKSDARFLIKHMVNG